jgi:hypothetical protein
MRAQFCHHCLVNDAVLLLFVSSVISDHPGEQETVWPSGMADQDETISNRARRPREPLHGIKTNCLFVTVGTIRSGKAFFPS